MQDLNSEFSGFGRDPAMFFTDKASRNHALDFITAHVETLLSARITEFKDQLSPSPSTGSYLRRIRLHTFSSPPQFFTSSRLEGPLFPPSR